MQRFLRATAALAVVVAAACGDRQPAAPEAPAAAAVQPSDAFAAPFTVPLSNLPVKFGVQVSWTSAAGADRYYVTRTVNGVTTSPGATGGTSLVDYQDLLASRGPDVVTWTVAARYEPPDCGQPPYPCDPVYYGSGSRTAYAMRIVLDS